MAIAEPVSKTQAPALPGLGRALVMAGKLSQHAAEEIYRKARAGKKNFVAELTESGAVSAADLAHTMSLAFAAPLIDIDAIDPQRLPEGLLDSKLALLVHAALLSLEEGMLTDDGLVQEALVVRSQLASNG